MDAAAVVTSTAIASFVASIVSGGLTALVQTLLTERFKASVKVEYDEKLERAKDDIKHQSDLELERFKSTLTIEASRRQIEFQHLQEKRAEIVAEVFTRLTDLKPCFNCVYRRI